MEKYKKTIIVGIIIAAGLIAYSFLRPDPTVESMLQVTERQNSAQVLGDEITTAINQIQSLKLDNVIFSDPIFLKLIDHSRPIVAEPIGRTNPFAPIGAVGDQNINQGNRPPAGFEEETDATPAVSDSPTP